MRSKKIFVSMAIIICMLLQNLLTFSEQHEYENNVADTLEISEKDQEQEISQEEQFHEHTEDCYESSNYEDELLPDESEDLHDSELSQAEDGTELPQDEDETPDDNELDEQEIIDIKPFMVELPAEVMEIDTTPIQVAEGKNHHMLLKDDGSVWTWGKNNYGQLGIGNNEDQTYPQKVAVNGIVAISAGTNYSLALDSSGRVWAWGYNAYGQLGDGTWTDKNEPVAVAFDDSVKIQSISAGDRHVMAITENGKNVWIWGSNDKDQLGTNEKGTVKTNLNTPIELSLTTIKQVAAGKDHSVLLKSDGTLYTWGDNTYGQLGNGNFNSVLKPTSVEKVGRDATIAAGDYHTVVMISQELVRGCGKAEDGQLGSDHQNPTNSLMTINLPTDDITGDDLIKVKRISAGGFYTAIVDCNDGLFGFGTLNSKNNHIYDGQKMNSTPVKDVSVGSGTVIMIRENNTVYGIGAQELATEDEWDYLDGFEDDSSEVNPSEANPNGLDSNGKIIWNANELPLGDIYGSYNGLEIIQAKPGSSKMVTVEKTTRHYLMSQFPRDEQLPDFTKCIKTYGASQVDENHVPTTRAFKFKTDRPLMLTVYGFANTDNEVEENMIISRKGEVIERLTVYKQGLEQFILYLENPDEYYIYSLTGSISICYMRLNEIIPGDFDGDGYVREEDVRLMVKYLYNPWDLLDWQILSADIDGDGKITESDKDLMLQILEDNNKYVPQYFSQKTWNISDFPSAMISSPGYEYSSHYDGLEITNDAVTIKDSNQSFEGASFSKCLKSSGGVGSRLDETGEAWKSIKINVDKPCELTFYAKSGSEFGLPVISVARYGEEKRNYQGQIDEDGYHLGMLVKQFDLPKSMTKYTVSLPVPDTYYIHTEQLLSFQVYYIELKNNGTTEEIDTNKVKLHGTVEPFNKISGTIREETNPAGLTLELYDVNDTTFKHALAATVVDNESKYEFLAPKNNQYRIVIRGQTEDSDKMNAFFSSYSETIDISSNKDIGEAGITFDLKAQNKYVYLALPFFGYSNGLVVIDRMENGTTVNYDSCYTTLRNGIWEIVIPFERGYQYLVSGRSSSAPPAYNPSLTLLPECNIIE